MILPVIRIGQMSFSSMGNALISGMARNLDMAISEHKNENGRLAIPAKSRKRALKKYSINVILFITDKSSGRHHGTIKKRFSPNQVLFGAVDSEDFCLLAVQVQISVLNRPEKKSVLKRFR